MKSSKMNKTSRIGQFGLVTLMVLSLSVGTVMAAPRTLDVYKINSTEKLSGFHEGSVNSSKNTEAVDLFKTSKVDFVKKYSENPKALADAFAALILDKVKDADASKKITKEDMTSIREELAKKDLESSFGTNKEGGLKSAAALKLFDLMVSGDFTKQNLLDQEYYSLFQKDTTLLGQLDGSLVAKEEKKEDNKLADNKPVETPTGEQAPKATEKDETPAIDFQKCADLLAEQSKPLWDTVNKLADQLKSVLARKGKNDDKKDEDFSNIAKPSAAEQFGEGLGNLLGRLGQQRDNNPPPQNAAATPSSGQQQTPPQNQTAQNDEPEQAGVPPQEEPPQIQKAPGEVVQTPPTQLVNATNPQAVTDKINNLAAKAKDPIEAANAIKSAINQTEQKWAPFTGNNPQALAAVKGAAVQQQKPAIEATVAEIDAQLGAIEPNYNASKSQLAQLKEEYDQKKEQQMLQRADSATRAAYAQLKDLISQTDETIGQLEQNPQGQQALAQAQAEKKRYKKQMGEIDSQLAALDPAFQKTIQNYQQRVSEAEAKLQEYAGMKNKLTSAKNELVSLASDMGIASALAGAQQPQLTRGATLGGGQAGQRPLPTNGGRTLPSQFTGSAPTATGTQRLPLNAK